jgi:hypothetical protein
VQAQLFICSDSRRRVPLGPNIPYIRFLAKFGGLGIKRIADIQSLNKKRVGKNDRPYKLRHHYTSKDY